MNKNKIRSVSVSPVLTSSILLFHSTALSSSVHSTRADRLPSVTLRGEKSGHFHIGKAMRAATAGINLWHPPWMIGNLERKIKLHERTSLVGDNNAAWHCFVIITKECTKQVVFLLQFAMQN